ncbi:hypothetical protein HG530_011167 [Fusarium avenaceum]|nr:hypothetical protein HG530_011167 [Fusarium avenaceum]
MVGRNLRSRSRAGGVRGTPSASVWERVGDTRGVGESAGGGGGDVGCLMSLRISFLRDRRLRKRQNMRAPMARNPTTEMIAIVTFTPKGIPLLGSVSFWSLLDGSEVIHSTSLSIAAVKRLERLILLHTSTVLQDLAHSLECLTLGRQLLEESLPTQGDTPWRILNIGRNEAPAMAAAASFLGGHLQPVEEGGE